MLQRDIRGDQARFGRDHEKAAPNEICGAANGQLRNSGHSGAFPRATTSHAGGLPRYLHTRDHILELLLRRPARRLA